MTHPALFFPLQSQLSYLGPCFLRSQLMRLILLPTAVSLNLSPGDLGSKISGGLWYLSYHQRFQTQEPWFSMVLFNSFRDTFGQGIFYWCTKTEPFRGGYNTKGEISFFSCNTVPDASTRDSKHNTTQRARYWWLHLLHLLQSHWPLEPIGMFLCRSCLPWSENL